MKDDCGAKAGLKAWSFEQGQKGLASVEFFFSCLVRR